MEGLMDEYVNVRLNELMDGWIKRWMYDGTICGKWTATRISELQMGE